MDPDEFINMFRETLDTKYGVGTADRATAEQRLRDRHQNLREKYREFYTKLVKERIQATNDSSLEQMLVNDQFVFADEERE